MPQGALLFQPTHFAHEPWTAPLRRLMPELEIRTTVDDRPGDITYCVAWRPAAGFFLPFPNLRVVFSMGAGVDGIVADQTYPKHIPLSRVVDDTLSQAMTEYVVLNVLYWHRRVRELEAWQRQKTWRVISPPRAEQMRLGILGYGVLAQAAATALRPLNYQLSAWSASPKQAEGVRSFWGPDGLGPFLGQTDILVCLLPLTPATRGILNTHTFAQLPKGAVVINCARGGHLIEQDLIAALDSGHLRGATLDVFQIEPLPESSPLWTHPNVFATPHAAAITDPVALARHVANSIRRMDQNLPPEHLVDLSRGY